MSKEEGEDVFDLPEHVIVNILYRLPVKSLLQFTCVCTLWHSIITDSKFATSTFQLASQMRTLRPRLLFATYPFHQLWGPRYGWQPSIFECLGDLDVSHLEGDVLVRSLTPPPEVRTEKVMASCNGLVVLGNTTSNSYTNLCVWNPTTGFYRKIADPEFLFRDRESIYSVSCAFGHVRASDDYKLIFFVSVDFTVHVFSTRDGSWKVMRFTQSSFQYDDDVEDEDLLASNGAIHWVSTGIPEAIFAFDLLSEEFRQLSLPRALIESITYEDDDMDARRIWTQVLVGGRLCVRSHNEYWVMEQYGVHESWVKLFQFSVVDLPHVFASAYGWTPAFVTEGSTVMMLFGGELVRIECHTGGKPVCSGRCKIKSVQLGICDTDVTVYDETLATFGTATCYGDRKGISIEL